VKIRFSIWTCIWVACAAANLPLLYILATRHLGAKHLFTLAAHAPNQFIFLPVFLPILGWQLGRLYGLAKATPHLDVAARIGRLRVPLVHLLAIVSVLLAAIAALTDVEARPFDFYWMKESDSLRVALDANRVAASGGVFYTDSLRSEFDGSEAPGFVAPSLREATLAVKRAYAWTDAHADRTLILLEAIELTASLALGALVMLLTGYILWAMLNKDLGDATKELSNRVVLCVLAGIAFCPLRAHNIREFPRTGDGPGIGIEPILATYLVVFTAALVLRYVKLPDLMRVMRQWVGALMSAVGVGVCAYLTSSGKQLSKQLYELSPGSVMIWMLVFSLAGLITAHLLRAATTAESPR
jgi:hypothetical protein